MVSEEAGERLAQQAAGPGLSHFSLALEPQLLTARHAARGGAGSSRSLGSAGPEGRSRWQSPSEGPVPWPGAQCAAGGGGGLGVPGAVISSTEE